MKPEGIWYARYALEQTEPFTREDGEPDEFGIGIFMNGQIVGLDPWGRALHRQLYVN